VGFCDGQKWGKFPLPIYIPSTSPQSSSLSPEAGTIGRSGRSANSLTNQNLKKKNFRPILVITQTRKMIIFMIIIERLWAQKALGFFSWR
jgi:hypothetical protein